MKYLPVNMEAIDRAALQVIECDHLMSALIYIIENVDDYQTELLRHSTVTLSWSVREKLKTAAEDVENAVGRWEAEQP